MFFKKDNYQLKYCKSVSRLILKKKKKNQPHLYACYPRLHPNLPHRSTCLSTQIFCILRKSKFFTIILAKFRNFKGEMCTYYMKHETYIFFRFSCLTGFHNQANGYCFIFRTETFGQHSLLTREIYTDEIVVGDATSGTKNTAFQFAYMRGLMVTQQKSRVFFLNPL